MSDLVKKSPKKIKRKLHQTFISLVDDEVIGTFLFKFYRNYLDFGGSSKHKVLSLNDRRTRHLKSILEKYDIEHIVNCAAVVVEKIDSGKVATSVVRPGYLDKILLNQSSQDKKNSGCSYD